ncbi:MAG: DUF2269 family protein [Dehalococcoidia bacterium]
MSGSEIFRLLHILSLFWMVAGLGAVLIPVGGNWAKKELTQHLVAFQQAADAETAMFLPGYLLVGVTGFFWGTYEDYNFITDGWLAALTATYLLVGVICVPLMDFALRRTRLLALQAQKSGAVSPELKDALDDNVPLVFGAIIALSVPLQAFFAIVKPF